MQFQIINFEGLRGVVICPKPALDVAVNPMDWEWAKHECDAIRRFSENSRYKGCQLRDKTGKNVIFIQLL